MNAPSLSHKPGKDIQKSYIQDRWLRCQVNFEDEIYFKGGRNVTPQFLGLEMPEGEFKGIIVIMGKIGLVADEYHILPENRENYADHFTKLWNVHMRSLCVWKNYGKFKDKKVGSLSVILAK